MSFATLPDGNHAGRYECLLSVCGNPACRCRTVFLNFVAQPPKSGQRQDAEWKAGLDLNINGVCPEFRKTACKKDIAFGEKLGAEMDAGDFRLLGQLHFSVKNRITENAKPDAINPQFDFAAIESSSTMQVYTDILPFGDRLLVAIDGVPHLLSDQHCVRTGCNCTETYIEVSEILPDGKQGEHAGTILVDYARRQWRAGPNDEPPRDLPALMQRIETAMPDFYTRISRRHAKLEAIYRHCMKRYLASTRATMPPPGNVGRNDLCPCGSGKKYKKCCMK